jgi:dephospho-CoA kinase
MKSIGITGGIGSGKSTVCRLFEVLGAPVYYADERARMLMNTDPELKRRIAERFGDSIYDNQGQLQRLELGRKVFADPQALAALNALVHPAVFSDALHWMEQHRGCAYVLREAALLFESGAYRQVDEVVMVWAPESLRLQRVIQRDGLSESEVRDRMSRQWPDEEKKRLAQHLINNDGLHALIPQVWALHLRWTSKPAAE